MSRFLAFALLGWAVLSIACAPNIPEKVTTDRLLALKKGMSYEQVEALIGPPLCVIEQQPYEEHCFAEPSPVPPELRNKYITLSYATPSPWEMIHSFEIYLNLEDARLTSVYVKYDDYGICCMDGLPTSPFYWIGSRDFLRQQIGR